MRKFATGALALTLCLPFTPTFAAESDKTPAASVKPPPSPAEPVTLDDFFRLALVITVAIKQAQQLGTLTTIFVVALALTHMLMFLAKGVLRANLGDRDDTYKKLLRPALSVLTVIAAGIGFYLGGVPVALASGIGAAASGPAHDLLDAQRH